LSSTSPGISKAGSPGGDLKASSRERILRVADELFFANGLFATGVNRIIEESGVAKATFYSAFKSKDDLIAAYLELRHRQLMSRFNDIEHSTANVALRVDRIFDLLAAEVQLPGFRGCLFVVASAELPDEDVAVSARHWIRIHKLAVRDCFIRILHSSDSSDSTELAEQLAILYDGALVTAAIRPDASPIDRARSMALRLVSDRDTGVSHRRSSGRREPRG
jgi:AcrR family transcriptional regulator